MSGKRRERCDISPGLRIYIGWLHREISPSNGPLPRLKCVSRLMLASVWWGQNLASIYTCSFLSSIANIEKSQCLIRSNEFQYHDKLMRTLLISSSWDIYHITRTWHIQFPSLLQRDEVYILSLIYFHNFWLAMNLMISRQNIERLFWKFMQILRIFLLVLKRKLTLDSRYLLLK